MHHEILLGHAFAQQRAALERAEHHRLIGQVRPRPRHDPRPEPRPFEGWVWVWNVA